MQRIVSQDRYNEMCNQMRDAMNYSSLTVEQKAVFDSQLETVMAEKGVTVDPGLSASSGNSTSSTDDDVQNRDEINNGIPSYENDDEVSGPSQDDCLEL